MPDLTPDQQALLERERVRRQDPAYRASLLAPASEPPLITHHACGCTELSRTPPSDLCPLHDYPENSHLAAAVRGIRAELDAENDG